MKRKKKKLEWNLPGLFFFMFLILEEVIFGGLFLMFIFFNKFENWRAFSFILFHWELRLRPPPPSPIPVPQKVHQTATPPLELLQTVSTGYLSSSLLGLLCDFSSSLPPRSPKNALLWLNNLVLYLLIQLDLAYCIGRETYHQVTKLLPITYVCSFLIIHSLSH